MNNVSKRGRVGNLAQPGDGNSTQPTADAPNYTCVYCHKPIDVKFNSLEGKLMAFFDMPKESGAHQKCLEQANSMVETDKGAK